jgi:hypothetical protein
MLRSLHCAMAHYHIRSIPCRTTNIFITIYFRIRINLTPPRPFKPIFTVERESCSLDTTSHWGDQYGIGQFAVSGSPQTPRPHIITFNHTVDCKQTLFVNLTLGRYSPLRCRLLNYLTLIRGKLWNIKVTGNPKVIWVILRWFNWRFLSTRNIYQSRIGHDD